MFPRINPDRIKNIMVGNLTSFPIYPEKNRMILTIPNRSKNGRFRSLCIYTKLLEKSFYLVSRAYKDEDVPFLYNLIR